MGMTEEERFRFDLAGFFVRPSILSEEDIDSIATQIDHIHHDVESLPPEQRCVPGGPSSLLIDHPQVVDVLNELIGPHVRLESAISMWRTKGQAHSQGLHSGGPTQWDPLFGYRVQNGRIYPGMMRVVFELAAVGRDDGATQFLVGSHKSNFPVVPEHASLDPATASPFLASYACPPGSAIFFTESLAHAGPPWRGEQPRIAVIHTYSHLATNMHRLTVPAGVIASLPRERQAFFRQVWQTEFSDSGFRHNTVDHFLESGDEPIESAF
jgi:Phytanoyl-CoA dioxygenase (PhyH)